MPSYNKELEKANIKFLHIEPDETLRQNLKNIVEEEIKLFFQAENILIAKKLFHNYKPEIIIINIDLSLKEEGKEFLDEIKFFLKQNQIIITSPKEKCDYIPELIELGVNNFIFTPFKKENVLHVFKNSAEFIELKDDFDKLNKIMLDIVKELNDCKKDREKIISERDEYKNITDLAPVGVMLLDFEYKIKYLNKTFTKIFGYEINDIPDGKTWLSLAYPDPLYKHEVISSWSKEVQKGFLNDRRDPLVFTVSCKDSTTKRVNFTPFKLETGDFLIFFENLDEYEKYKNKFVFTPNIDTLTGLPNRRSLEASLRQLIEKAKSSTYKRGSNSVMIFANIDDFQEINQNYGHIAGDEVLITVAKLFKNSLRTGDSVFRFEGDEFVVLLKGTSMAEAKLAAERLQKTINQHTFVFDYTKCSLNITMGVIQIDGSMDTTTLLSNAVQIVRKSKKEGKNIISVYHKNN
ncbi:MAG TPA: diguanylate cyclase [Syntrophorhabdaceae bacterium]|nr:diguanylate cyclase [Syntrophorhabdaceae bacterium]HPU29530.1 diguanylate cyclase [Syntrophorhabdaceae bacterium]